MEFSTFFTMAHTTGGTWAINFGVVPVQCAVFGVLISKHEELLLIELLRFGVPFGELMSGHEKL